MLISLFFTYWIANLDLVFLAVTLPSLLLNTIGETMLGIGLIRSGFRPRLTGWVLALSCLLTPGIGHGADPGTGHVADDARLGLPRAGRFGVQSLRPFPTPMRGRSQPDADNGRKRADDARWRYDCKVRARTQCSMSGYMRAPTGG